MLLKNFLVWGVLKNLHHTKYGFLGSAFLKVPFEELPANVQIEWFEGYSRKQEIRDSVLTGFPPGLWVETREEVQSAGVGQVDVGKGGVEVSSPRSDETWCPGLSPALGKGSTRGHTKQTSANFTSPS